jgi:hypothetical protein
MPLREFKKGIVEGPAPVKWAWGVAIFLVIMLGIGAGYGLYGLVALLLGF